MRRRTEVIIKSIVSFLANHLLVTLKRWKRRNVYQERIKRESTQVFSPLFSAFCSHERNKQCQTWEEQEKKKKKQLAKNKKKKKQSRRWWVKGKGFLVFSRLQLLLQSVLTTLQVKANRETTEQTMADQKELQKKHDYWCDSSCQSNINEYHTSIAKVPPLMIWYDLDPPFTLFSVQKRVFKNGASFNETWITVRETRLL